MRPPIALCVTCLVDQFMPEVGVATVRLLRRAGVQVVFPPEQSCCGQPFFNSGFREEAAALARRTIAIFEPYEAVVLPSGSCTTMIRVEYPHLLAGDPAWEGRAVALAGRTFELSEYLVTQTGWPEPTAEPADQPPAGPPVTYHDSCHMCRLLQLAAEPRRLLAAAGARLVEMAEPDRCCGFGGLFSLRLPEVANAMTAAKLRQGEATGAEQMVTADPGCLLQLRGLAGAGGLPVTHLAVILEALTRERA